MTTARESTPTPRSTHRPPGQLVLPFLADDDVATIDQAAAAVQRATANAVAAGRRHEADELAELGDRLTDLIVRNAERVRAAR